MPPPLPNKQVATPPPLPRRSSAGWQNGCAIAALAGVGIFSLGLFQLQTWRSEISQEAEAAKDRLKATFEQAEKRVEATPVIPGMLAVDVYLNLEEKGFKTHKEFNAGAAQMLCQKMDADGLYLVGIQCAGASKVIAVEATVEPSTPITSDAREFLAYIATLPYDGAKPEAARSWVKSHFGQTATTQIGGVQFHLFPLPKTTAQRLIIRLP
jgi:hypothetical protein